MTQKQTTIVIPAFNEEDVLRFSLDRIVKDELHLRYEIIFVDDGSVDRTHEIISEYPVKVLRHHVNKGYGAALKTGIRHSEGERVILMDSDGQHDPCYIAEIDKLLDSHDMVIGERSATSYQVKRRKAGKRMIRRMGEYLVEQKLPDYNSGFRGFQKEIIEGMLHLMPNGFSFSTTSTLAFLKEGYNVEGPVPPDTLFPKALGKYYDGCVVMYHDQGHIPFKMAGFAWNEEKQSMESVIGVNVTLGLPIIRTSVDHGTAFDIAGKGIASEAALLDAIEYAIKMYLN